MPVVTISSQRGAGAREVGQGVAERLQLDYVDHQVLIESAQILGVTVNRVAARDEKIESLRQRLGHFLERALERSAGGGTGDPFIGAGTLEMMLSQTYQDVTDEDGAVRVDDNAYLETITRVITDVADRGSVVIVGRGSQMILQGWPNTVHLQLVADLPLRVARMRQWESLNEEEARRRIKDFDRSRARFHKRFWKIDVLDPQLYDAVLNTTDLSFAAAAAIATMIVQARAKTTPVGA